MMEHQLGRVGASHLDGRNLRSSQRQARNPREIAGDPEPGRNFGDPRGTDIQSQAGPHPGLCC